MDKLVVRLSIIVLNLYILIVLIYAFNGIDISEYDYLFTNSFTSGIILTTLCHAQGKYHCIYMRTMCYDLVIIPIINYIDFKYQLFQTIESCIYTYCFIVLMSILSTLILAIRHFIRVKKLIRKRNGIL